MECLNTVCTTTIGIRGLFQFRLKRPVVRSRKDWNPQNWVIHHNPDRYEIGQVARNRGFIFVTAGLYVKTAYYIYKNDPSVSTPKLSMRIRYIAWLAFALAYTNSTPSFPNHLIPFYEIYIFRSTFIRSYQLNRPIPNRLILAWLPMYSFTRTFLFLFIP